MDKISLSFCPLSPSLHPFLTNFKKHPQLFLSTSTAVVQQFLLFVHSLSETIYLLSYLGVWMAQFGADLHEDSKNGDLRKVKRWLERGTPINARKEGYTALHRACQFGHLEVVKFLLEKGADIHARTFGYYTPLHWAAEGGHKEVAQFLIEQGADPSAPLQNGKFAHELAQEAGHQELSEFLAQEFKKVVVNQPNGLQSSESAPAILFEHERLRAEASGAFHFSANVQLSSPDQTHLRPPLSTTTSFNNNSNSSRVSGQESSESYPQSDLSSQDSTNSSSTSNSRYRYNTTILPSTDEEITQYKSDMKQKYEKQMKEEAGKKIMDLSSLTKKAKKTSSFFWKK